MPSPVRIGARQVGPGQPCYVIAEAGVNHDGSLERALELVEVAAAAGADAVKFQTFRADELAGAEAPKAAYQEAGTPGDETQQAMLRRLELSREDHRALARRCAERGLTFLSTPFDLESARLLVELGVPALKVPSGELTNLPFLEQLAGLGLPLIVSTGMASEDEVAAAVERVRAAPGLVLLHCVSLYPAPAETANLRAMQTLATRFEVPVGFSDHTLGDEVALGAVALGANLLEKHYTTSRALPGPDHAASLEPAELAALVTRLRRLEAALGDGRKRPAPGEDEVARVARRSLCAAEDLSAGTRLERAHLTARRPGDGLPPARLEQVLGRALAVDLPRGAQLRLEMLQ